MINGSSFGASAINNSSDRTTPSVSPATHIDGATFSVDVSFVGKGSTEGQRINVSSDGTYHFIDPTADDGFNLVRLKTNITGYTCFGDCTNSSLAADRTVFEATAGSIFIIVDGNVLPAGAGYMSSSGSDVPIAGLGDHTVTFLYIGKDSVMGTVYAYETFIVRIATDEANLDPYVTSTTPITASVTDTAVANKYYNSSAVGYYDPSWSSWTKEDFNQPTADVSVLRDGESTSQNVVDNLNGTTLSIGGTINSTGFDGLQIVREQNTTVGNAFFLDAAGITPLGDVTELTYYDNAYNPAACDDPFNRITHVGVLVLADNGRWVQDAVSYPPWQTPFADFEGLNSVTDTLNSSITYKLNASMDYTYAVDSQGYWFASGAPPAGCTITTTTTDISTSTSSTTTSIVTTSTRTNDVTETTVKTESPGFGVIVSLLSIGVIAFVAPRLRREN
jgi:hypothetical protein